MADSLFRGNCEYEQVGYISVCCLVRDQNPYEDQVSPGECGGPGRIASRLLCIRSREFTSERDRSVKRESCNMYVVDL